MKSLPKEAQIGIAISKEVGVNGRLGRYSWPYMQCFYFNKDNFEPDVAKQKHLSNLSREHRCIVLY